MSSSRSDVVTQFVCPCVRPSVPSFSFSVLGVLSSPKEFQWCFEKVRWMFEDEGAFQERFKVFQGRLNDVSR